MTLPKFLSDLDFQVFGTDNYIVVDLETDTSHGDHGSAVHPRNKLLLACWRYGPGHPRYRPGLNNKRKIWGGEYDMAPLITAIEEADLLVAHHAKYELMWLHRCGLDLYNVMVFDTMIAEYVLLGNLAAGDETMPRKRISLDMCCRRRHWRTKDPAVDILMKNGINPRNIPATWLQGRCEQDVEDTERLYHSQYHDLLVTGRLGLQYTRCLLTPVLAHTEFQGMKLDGERVEEEFAEYNKQLVKLEKKMNAMTGGINWKSSDQVAEFIYDTLGFEELKERNGQPKRTPQKTRTLKSGEVKITGGKRKTDSKTLEKLKAKTKKQKDYIKLKAELGKVAFALSKNLEFFMGVVKELKGIFHAEFNQTNTATHRLSSNGIKTFIKMFDAFKTVQFQNLPRVFKRLFCARTKGWYMAETDGCYTAGHRMHMANGQVTPVEAIKPGDKVIGFDESARGVRKMHVAEVVATKRRRSKCYRVHLEDGRTVTVSANHQFLGSTAHSKALEWLNTLDIKQGGRTCYISAFSDAPEAEDSQDLKAWGALGAMIDCDGSVSHDKFQITQSIANVTCDRIVDVLRQTGHPIRQYKFKQSSLSTAPVASYNITGIPALLRVQRFADSIKVAKRFHGSWCGKAMSRNKRVKVLAVEDAGEQEVYSIETTSKTYIVEGLCNHNCQLEFRVAAHLTRDPQAKLDIESGHDVHRFTASVLFRVAEDELKEWLDDPDHPEFKRAKGYRQNAKPHTFKPLYGGQSGTVREVAYYDAFRQRYSRMAQVQAGWVTNVCADHRLITEWGMRYYWPYARVSNSGYCNYTSSIYNYPIQAFATAEIIPIAIVFFWHRIKQMGLEDAILLVNTVHDSVICEVAQRAAEQYKELSIQAFTHDVYAYLEKVYDVKFDFVPLGVGVTIGEHWSEGKEEAFNVYYSGKVEEVA